MRSTGVVRSDHSTTARDRAAEEPAATPNGLLRRNAWPLAVAATAILVGAVDVWWLVRFRSGFPLDVDESGYLWFSFTLQDALGHSGLGGLLHGFQHEGWVGPLLPLLTAILGPLGIGKSIVASLGVQLVFFAVLVYASYGIGCRLRDRRAGALTALVVATTPAVTDFVRTYHLVIPSTAMYTFSLYALLASARLHRRRWVIAWGIGLGLTLLARSMMLAFVPAALLAGGWIAVVDRARGRRLVNLAFGLAAFACTTLLWYGTSWRPILSYLTRAGYGAESRRYGPSLSPLSTEFWTHELTGAVQNSLYLPLAAMLALTLMTAAIARSWRVTTLRTEIARAVRSDHVVLAIAVGEGYLALTSSRNDGTGFVVPLLPAFIALTVVSALGVRWSAARAALVVGAVLVALFDVAMKADVWAAVSRERAVRIPVYGWATLTNGEGYLHQHLANVAAYPLGPPTRWLPPREREWPAVYDRLARYLQGLHRPWLLVDFAPAEPVLNTAELRLYANRVGFVAAEYANVDTGGHDSVDAYQAFLERVHPDIVVTTDRSARGFGPQVDPRLVEMAARALRYTAGPRFQLPDGRQLRLWKARSPS